MEAVFSGKFRYLCYGGAIRGGKSYGVMAIIFTLCKLFPGSRWAIVRKDLPTLKRTIFPTFEKLRPQGFIGPIQDTRQDGLSAKCANGSVILFFPESLKDDPDYSRWKGLEVNGFWLEQAEELAHSTWHWALQRAGSWIIPISRHNPQPVQPTPYILLTTNPTANWVKRDFYTPWKQGQLRAPYYYIPATVLDNPHLPQAYLDSLELLPERDYKVYVMGDWDELEGAALEELNPNIHIIPRPRHIPNHWFRFGAFDWGYAHPFSFGLYAASSEHIFKVETITGRKMADASMLSYILEVAESVEFPATDLQYVSAGKDAFHDVQARSNIGETTAERFAKAGIPMIPADTSRISGLKNFREMTSWKKRGPKGTPGLPIFQLFDTPSNRKCFEELQNMVLDPDRPEDVLKVDADEDGHGGDDLYDETRYALQSRVRAFPAPAEDTPEDHHPGFDYKKKERKPRKQKVPEPLTGDRGAAVDDDVRPGVYRMPQGGMFRMPRMFSNEDDPDDE